MAAKKPPTIPLPKGWTKHVRTAMLHVISLAQYATAYTRSWAADSTNARLRIKAENDRSQQDILLLREEMRIKDACPRPASFLHHSFPLNPQARRCAVGVAPENAGRACSFSDNRLKESCCRHHDCVSSTYDQPHPWTSTQLASTGRRVDGDASCRSRLSSRTVVPVFLQRVFEVWHMVNYGANWRVAQSWACGWQGSESRRLHSESCLQANRGVDAHCTTE